MSLGWAAAVILYEGGISLVVQISLAGLFPRLSITTCTTSWAT